MSKFLWKLATCLMTLWVSPVDAGGSSRNVSSACSTTEFMAKMVALNMMFPRAQDNLHELHSMSDALAELNKIVCQPVILTSESRYNSRYSNGTLISLDLYDEAWYFPNGQLFMAGPGEDGSIYYPNGLEMSYHWIHEGEALFWPNGRLATEYFWFFNEPWYYPDGNVITYESGYQGGRWFYPFPRLDGAIGQEVISSEWGVEDENFTFLNFDSAGYIYTTRERIRRKLIFSDFDLLDVPGVLLLLTRLYRVDDNVKDFVPADANITAVPF